MKHYKFIILITLLSPLLLISSNVLLEGEIDWEKNVISKVEGESSRNFLSFKNAKYDEKKDFLPFYSKQLRLNQENIVSLNIINIEYEDVEVNKIKEISGVDFITEDIELRFTNGINRKVNYGEVIFTPIIYNSKKGKYQRVVKYKIQVNAQKKYTYTNTNKSFTSNSVLETADWYKIAVLKDGVFKLSYQFQRI